ncbi:hypothetical protein FWK35_00003500, partial [Aphis craccivora]
FAISSFASCRFLRFRLISFLNHLSSYLRFFFQQRLVQISCQRVSFQLELFFLGQLSFQVLVSFQGQISFRELVFYQLQVFCLQIS